MELGTILSSRDFCRNSRANKEREIQEWKQAKMKVITQPGPWGLHLHPSSGVMPHSESEASLDSKRPCFKNQPINQINKQNQDKLINQNT